jgi:hypothetical protein
VKAGELLVISADRGGASGSRLCRSRFTKSGMVTIKHSTAAELDHRASFLRSMTVKNQKTFRVTLTVFCSHLWAGLTLTVAAAAGASDEPEKSLQTVRARNVVNTPDRNLNGVADSRHGDPGVPETIAGQPPFRRLFLDAMVVEKSQGLERVFHAAEKYRGNPIIRRDKPWEGWGPYVYGTVMRHDGKLKMWYQVLGKDSADVCYAESQDGLTWVKPDLGIVEFNGAKQNNIVAARKHCHLPGVIRLASPDSPDKRWAMYGYRNGPQVAFSADGLNWNWEEAATEPLFKSSDVTNYFYDPYRKRFVSTYKTPNRRHRAVGVAWSNDGRNWEKPFEGAVFGADDLDPDATQIYGMPVFPYQGAYIGLPWIYHARWIKYGRYSSPDRMHEAQEDSPLTVDVQLAWSWDLINWTRTPGRVPFISLGPPGSFDSGMIFTARNPVVVDDKLYFYYGGFDKVHDDAKGVQGAIGLAIIRLDGFCSMHAGDNEGWLISRREVFRTPRVVINAATYDGGYVEAELLDRDNRVIPGFSRGECFRFQGDVVRGTLQWKTKAFPKEWQTKDKKIRFYVRNANLYSYLPAAIDPEQDDGWPDY